MKKEYVLIFVRHGDDILLVQKNRPSWQAGLFNLPGGKIEPHEAPIMAAARELHEETDLLAFYLKEVGWVDGDGYQIYVFAAVSHHPEHAFSKTDELICWMNYRDALLSPQLIPNLRIMIPLLMAGVDSWVMRPVTSRPLAEDWNVSVAPQLNAA